LWSGLIDCAGRGGMMESEFAAHLNGFRSAAGDWLFGEFGFCGGGSGEVVEDFELVAISKSSTSCGFC